MDRRQEIEEQIREIESLNIATLENVCFQLAESKGWHEKERTFGDIVALIHSEASEALEEHREGHEPAYVYVEREGYKDGFFLTFNETIPFSFRHPKHKPEGIPIELADIVIRILDYCGKNDIDLMTALKKKLLYNLGRHHRHGGKRI